MTRAPRKHAPRDYHYNIIRGTCVKSLLEYEGPRPSTLRIKISLPFSYKFPKGFPKAIVYRGEAAYSVYAVLQWLYDKGHSDVSPATISAAKQSHSISQVLMERFLNVENILTDIPLDNYQLLEDNDVIGN